MALISYPNFLKSRDTPVAQDWSQQEIADFYRAHRLLVDNGAAIGLDRGTTDIGEPWIVFFDVSTQDVFMHVARINGRCILVCEQLNIELKAPNVASLMVEFDAAIRDHLVVRAQRSTNVLLHPAARIIMSISVVFLLFKLDNNSATMAKGMSEERGAGPDAAPSRLQEGASGSMQRAQGIFTRLLEKAESPGHVALLAGILLSAELGRSAARMVAEPSQVQALEFAEVVTRGGQPAAVIDFEGIGAATVGQDARSLEAAPVIADPSLLFSLPVAIQTNAAIAPLLVEADHTHNSSSAVIPVPLAAPHETERAEGKIIVSSAPQPGPEAFELVESVLGWELNGEQGIIVVAEKGSHPPPLPETPAEDALIVAEEVVPAPVVITLQPPTHTISDISISTLDAIDENVGLFVKTAMVTGELRDMIQHFMSAFGADGYEIEFRDDVVLIEQSNTVGLADAEIGLWTNTMSDGSSISVIGAVHIIDDVNGVFV
ncbi:MAG TPA: hypothetical protein VGN98_10905 [Tianweitania sediminis]|jgi:hypothetical protein|nr:hypothetical protein [Tianweitania sediminis]